LLRCDAIVFDFDGVLVESVDVKTRAFAALYAPYGPEACAAVVAYHLEHGGLSRYEKFRHCHRAFLGRELAPEEERALGERFAALVEDAVVAAPWVAGAREFLEAFHARLPLFVASGTPEEELLRIVERRGMRRYFAGVRGAPAAKAQIIAGFAREACVAPERVLMVGDSSTDYEGARRAGAQFVRVAPPTAPAFAPEVPVLPDLAGLARHIGAAAELSRS
jgi:HAD superfamily hydrolase (TIGR01549 family)